MTVTRTNHRVDNKPVHDAISWARRVGFPERHIQFAALIAVQLKRKKGSTTKAEVLDQMRIAYPFLESE